MRKTVVLLCVLFLSGAMAASAQQELRGRDWGPDRDMLQPQVWGDVNGNRVQDMDDVATLLGFVDGLVVPAAWQLRVGDLDLDGRLTDNDARILLEKVDFDGTHYAMRIKVEVEPSGETRTIPIDLVARLRGNESNAAVTLTNSNFTQISSSCTNCGGACTPGVSTRTISTVLRFRTPVSQPFAGIDDPAGGDFLTTNRTYVNCTGVSSSTSANSPTCVGDDVTRNRTVLLTTCSLFGFYFDVTGNYDNPHAGCGAPQ